MPVRLGPRAFAIIASVTGLTALAWSNRFFQDDAYFSLRCASNLVLGHGLVWNPGERVEGYTNFLWTLLMAIPIRLGLDPVLFSHALGMALFASALVTTHFLAARFLRSFWWALGVLAALGTNYTYSCYATGGLETQLQALLVAGGLLVAGAIYERAAPSVGLLLAYGMLVTLAMLTRLDSVLLLSGSFVLVTIARYRRSARPGRRVADALVLVGLPTLVLGGWLAWKWSFYGDLLPPPFYLKVGGPTSILRGLYYVGAFFASYLLFPFPLLWASRAAEILRSVDLERLTLLALPIALWAAYVVKVGGDFMEFRLLVPTLPLLMIVIVWSVRRWVASTWLRFGLLALLPIGSVGHAATFDRFLFLSRGMVTIPGLQRQLDDPRQNWVGIGRYLGRVFEGRDSVRIGVTAGGAIPFHSGLPAVDMTGLTDRWVSAHGFHRGNRPGHQRIASVAYLRERGVNLVIGHPVVVEGPVTDAAWAASRLGTLFGFAPIPDPQSLPADATILAIPFDPPRVLLCIYLSRSRAVDEVARAQGWSAFPLLAR